MHYARNEVTIINELPRTYRKFRFECGEGVGGVVELLPSKRVTFLFIAAFFNFIKKRLFKSPSPCNCANVKIRLSPYRL